MALLTTASTCFGRARRYCKSETVCSGRSIHICQETGDDVRGGLNPKGIRHSCDGVLGGAIVARLYPCLAQGGADARIHHNQAPRYACSCYRERIWLARVLALPRAKCLPSGWLHVSWVYRTRSCPSDGLATPVRGGLSDTVFGAVTRAQRAQVPPNGGG